MSIISASTTTTTALQYTADTTGTLVFKTGASPTTALTLNDDQSATFAGTVNFAAAGFTSLSISGNLTFTGTGNRIRGDFSNATVANRVMLQTSTADTNTTVGILPNGTAISSLFTAYNSSDPTNTSFTQIGMFGTESRITSGITGTGTYRNLTMYTGGSERLRIDTSGNVGIGTSAPLAKVHIVGGYTAFQFNSGGTYPNYNNFFGAIGSNFSNGGSELDIWNTVNSGFVFRKQTGASAQTELMRINGDGNVGIGTTTPSNKLEVIGGTIAQYRATGDNGGISVSSGSASYNSYVRISNSVASVDYGQGNGAAFVNVNNSQPWYIATGSGERMRVSSAGGVSIGTSVDPGAGKISATGGWAGTNSSAGRVAGTVMSFACERGGVGAVGYTMAFGNGQSAGVGILMPFAGKLVAGTIVGTNVTGTITVQAYVNSSPNASYQLSVTGSANNPAQTQNWNASPLAFNANDSLSFYQAAAPASATCFTVTFYVVFD